MQFSIENISNLKYRITIIVNANKINDAIENKFSDLTKKIRIDGFRKGKVPINIIQDRYGLSVNKEVLDNIMYNKFIEAITKENIIIVGKQNYIPGVYKKNENFTYCVEFETYPKIKLKKLKDIKIEKPLVKITEEDIDSVLESLRKQKANWIINNNIVQINDRVTINFIGSINGKIFKECTNNNFIMILGQGIMIKKFEDSIIGHKINDRFDVEIEFPIDYNQKNLQGKKINFNILLKKIETLNYPNINVDFIKSFGIKDGSISNLRISIYKNIEFELKKIIRDNIKLQVINSLIQENKINLPQTLIDHEMKLMYKNSTESLYKNSKNNEINLESFRKKAEHNVKVRLLLGEVIRISKIKIDEKRVFSLLKEISYSYTDSKKIIKLYNKNEKLMNNIRNIVLEEQAIEYILDKAQITDKITNFQNIISHNTTLSFV